MTIIGVIPCTDIVLLLRKCGLWH